MGIFDTIGDALGGKVAQPDSGPSDTKTTKITPEDIAIAQRRRNSPEFQAALRARDAALYAHQSPAAPQAFQPPLPQGSQ